MKRAKIPFGRLLWFLCEIVAGVLLLIDPAGFTVAIIRVGGWLLLALGVAFIIQYFATAPLDASKSQGLLKGLCAVGGGLCCVLRFHWLLSLFPSLAVIYSVVILFLGLVQLQWAVDALRLKGRSWFLHGLWGLLALAFAYWVLSGRVRSSIVWIVLGVALIIGAVIDLLILCLFRGERKK